MKTALAAFALAVLTAYSAIGAVRIDGVSSHPLMDERLAIAISGLRANAAVAVTAQSRAQDGLAWRSEAVFRANAQGRIDLTAQAPLSGSYRGADGMGLFWSLHPDDAPKNADHAFFAISDFAKPVATRLEVRDGGALVAALSIERRFAAQNVRAALVRGGIVGMLYEPNDGARHPGVLVIGGSDGGFGEPDVAMLLASHGYAALSLAYFGEPGLPQTLQAVPMEYFARAVRWMQQAPGVDPKFVAVYGASRGTEPALYTAANTPGIAAVIARSPSFALWGGVTASHLPGGAAWTANGKPLPYIANTLYPGFLLSYAWDRLTGTPVPQTPLFLENLSRFGDTSVTEIPVEKIRGPVLLLAGRDDQIWPSSLMAKRILARLCAHAHPYVDRALLYDGVGHPIPYAYLPTKGDREASPFAVGGTPEATAKAQADAWPNILLFLKHAASLPR